MQKVKKDIRIIGKKTLVCLLGVSMVVGTFLSVPYKAKASAVQSIPIKITYGQTEARTMIDSINNLRTDKSQAWAYDESNNKVSYQGLSKLQYDYGLEKIAMKRAVEIALSYGHTRPNGNECFTAYNVSYNAAGENIAAGQRTADEVFDDWKEENENYSGQGHRRNMLSYNFTSVGIGHVKFEGTDYWVQEFSSPSTEVSDDGANDSTSVENIETSDDYIKGMKTDKGSISLKKGDAVDVSDMKLMLLINNHYSTYGGYGKYCTTESDYEASVDDSSIAEYNNGKLTGLGAGKTKLVISAYGRTCDVEINVEEPVSEEKPAVTTPTPVVTETPAVTPTPIATETPVVTPTPIATETPAVTPTPIATETPVVTPTPIATETPVVTPTPIATETPVGTPKPAETEKPKENVPVTSMKIAARGKVHLVVTGKDGKNNNASVRWQSDNTKYATINSDGVVKFKKAGIGKTVVMTATSKSDNHLVKKVKIKILKNAVTGIKVKNAPKTLKAGKSITLKAVVYTNGKDANKSLTWSSSNSKYLTVNSKGKIVAKKAGKGKTVYVYAAATDGSGKKVKIKIKIK